MWKQSTCLILATALLGGGAAVTSAAPPHCQVALYDSTAFETEQDQFTPEQKVIAKVDCEGLATGPHRLHMNWVHQQIGLFRSDELNLEQTEERHRSVFFWFKLNKKGPLSSAFSGSDYGERLLGEWQAELFLDDQKIATAGFAIDYFE